MHGWTSEPSLLSVRWSLKMGHRVGAFSPVVLGLLHLLLLHLFAEQLHAVNITRFDATPPPPPQSHKRGTFATTAVPTYWVLSFNCALNVDQIVQMNVVIQNALPGCYIDTAGQGIRAVLLRVTCDAPSSDVVDDVVLTALHAQVEASLGSESTCIRGLLYAITRDTRVQVNPSAKPGGKRSLESLESLQAPAPWHLDRIDQRHLPLDGKFEYENAGAGVTIYIEDTGVRTTHSEFQGRAELILDLVVPACNCDCNGHGTHVAGLACGSKSGVAKAARLKMIRVLDCRGNGFLSSVILGLVEIMDRQIVAPHPAVLSLSLAGAADSLLDNYVNSLVVAYRVAVAVAAGNDAGDAGYVSPARAAHVLTVAASTIMDTPTSFTNLGSVVDLFAPGDSILSAWYLGDTSMNTLRGTSQATPQVAGFLAVLAGVQAPVLNASKIQAQLLSLARASGSIRIAGTLPLLHTRLTPALPSVVVLSPSPSPSSSPSPSAPLPPMSPLAPTIATPVKVLPPAPSPRVPRVPPPPPPLATLPLTTSGFPAEPTVTVITGEGKRNTDVSAVQWQMLALVFFACVLFL